MILAIDNRMRSTLIRVLAVFSVAILFACSGNDETLLHTVDISSPFSADFQIMTVDKGCLQCHAYSKDSTGPSFEAINAKYNADPAALNALVRKINIGSPNTDMPAFSSQLNGDEILQLAKGIMYEDSSFEREAVFIANANAISENLTKNEERRFYFAPQLNNSYELRLTPSEHDMGNGTTPDTDLTLNKWYSNLSIDFIAASTNNATTIDSLQLTPNDYNIYEVVVKAVVDSKYSLQIIRSSNLQGINLAERSGCLICHSVDTTITGPAFSDIALLYQGDSTAEDMLVEKVKNGGTGTWNVLTNDATMPAQSPKVSDRNIRELVQYILGL